MTVKKIVLVTGVADYWGDRVARQLAADTNNQVIGLDVEEPKVEIKGLNFIQADIRSPLLADLLKAEHVDTVCHLKFVESDKPDEADFEINVFGSMKVLGACVQAHVHKVIIISTTAVYGAHPDNSSFLIEEHPLRGSLSNGYIRVMVEVEKFLSDFLSQGTDVMVTILRFPGIIGPTSDTPLTRYLRKSLVPVLLGFDPMMQIIHEDDVVQALAFASLNDVHGIYNVAAEGVMPLRRLIGLAGKIPIPVFHPIAYWGAALFSETSLRLANMVPIELEYLRYPWVTDLNKMHNEFGYTPRYNAEQALVEFAEQSRLRKYNLESVHLAPDEEQLPNTIEHRTRLRRPNVTQPVAENRGDDDE